MIQRRLRRATRLPIPRNAAVPESHLPAGAASLTLRAACASVLLAGLTLFACPAVADPWRSVFSAESDTTFFLSERGDVVRAPFGLQTSDTLWRCPKSQHVVRMLASPRGGRVAWTSRGLEEDTTRLWIASGRATELRLRYFAMQPRRHGQQFAEITWPTTADAVAGGRRLIPPTGKPLGPSANSLAWAAEGRAVLVSYDGGIASVVSGGRGVARLTGHLAMRMETLHPSDMLLVDALDSASVSSRALSEFDLEHIQASELETKEGRVVESLQRRKMLLRPASGRLQECEAAEWLEARVRAVGALKLWWADGRFVRSTSTGDCGPDVRFRTPGAVRWLAYEPASRLLMGLSGRTLWCVDEEGNDPTAVLHAQSDVRTVLRAVGGAGIALVVRDSLLTWNPASGAVRRFGHPGPDPDVFLECDEGQVVVARRSEPGQPVALARSEPDRGTLVPVEVPHEARWDTLLPGPRGAWVLLYEPGSKAPGHLHAYDVKARCWHTVENPGICAWEPYAR